MTLGTQRWTDSAKAHRRERALSISLELGSGEGLRGNDGMRMERKPYETGAPLQGDLRSVSITSSGYIPFQSLMKYLNLLAWRCEGFKAISSRCS